MDKVAANLSRVVCRTASSAHKPITLEVANFAKFSDGACTCTLGDTSVLVTAVSHPPQKSTGSFVPLTVDYRQKAAAAGRIPMTHLRRDIGVTEQETLTARMIDRSIRPAFPKGFNNDTQIICNLLAVDGHNDPDVLAINGASTSLTISDIPWEGPIGAVRMGLIGDNLIVNPSRREQADSRLNLVLSANQYGSVMMMDGSCKEPILIVDLMKAIKYGVKECTAIVDSIIDLRKAMGKRKRELDLSNLPSEEQKNLALKIGQNKIKEVLSNHSFDKTSRDEAMMSVRTETIEALKEAFPNTDPSIFNDIFNYAVKKTYMKILSSTKVRCDGRKFGDLRPISCKVDLYKPLHGSSIFQRGQTQVFCSTTFDSSDAAFRSDPTTLLMSGVKEKNFMLHYEFPPFATNDIGKVSLRPDRREIGHGALAEKGIRPVVPENQDMTIRLNCEVMESNGSSSMASVCAGSLSLMDAGVKIQEHIAGVAMGLMSDFGEQPDMKEQTTEHHILTDILGFEDYIGDMDFKIAGTKKAVTAIQLDVKPMYGIPPSVLYKAIQKAHLARSEIINIMSTVIKEPRKEKKDNHPVIKAIHISPHEEAKFIGSGGKNLKKLTAQIGVRISEYSGTEYVSSEMGDDSPKKNYLIFAPNQDAMREAEEFISTLLVKEPELAFNGIYTATIQEIRPNGVMVTLYSGMRPTLLHLSQLDIRSVNHPSALGLEVGQEIQVKYFDRDPSSGQMRLSRKSLQMSSIPRVRQGPLK